ncbi:MAG: DUF2214 family protein [Thermonemataceae bacterium]
MIPEILLRYVHFICIFIIVGSIVGQHLLLKKEMPPSAIKRLFFLDNLYGAATIFLLAAGFTLWFGVGKPAAFYSTNWIFHLKIGLFGLMGILSLVPSLFFRKYRKGTEATLVVVPARVFWVIRIELLLLLLIPMMASLMARGIGSIP